jgi:hypothetical protein
MKATNPTDLDLSFTLPAVQGFDYAGLKAWAEGIKAKYADVVVMEDQVVGTKAEMAELNRIKKQLDAARIQAVKKVSEPIKDFEAQVKEVCGIFQETYDFLGGQVKNYEERAREEKRAEVLFAIQTLTAEAGYPGLEVPVQDSWLNKSQKPSQTAADIQAFILRHTQAEKAAAAAEQAKRDRAAYIELKCQSLAAQHGVSLQPSYFLGMNNLALSSADVDEHMERVFTTTAAARASAPPVPPTAPVAAPAPQAQPSPAQAPLAQPQGTLARKTLTVVLEFSAAKEAEVNMALRHLEAQGVSITRGFTGGSLPSAASDVPQAQAPQRARNY